MSSFAQTASQIADEVAKCDKLLIVAAAGLTISADLPNNPYHNPEDFKLHYPLVRRYGYQTSYHAMGISRDPSVPDSVKLGYTARHLLNMRYRFPPTPAYAWLRELANSFETKDPDSVFCWTSNVDGCFVRSGFKANRVWTTQGDMSKYQCLRCKNIWECESQLRAIDEACTPEGELKDMSLVMKCPKCKAPNTELRPNLRGGDWFDHSPYASTQQSLLSWLDAAIQMKSRVAVLEIGVGPNTPIVTRIPAAAFASALAAAGGKAIYVRINPDRPEPESQNPHGDPNRLHFIRIRQKWDVLKSIVDETIRIRSAQNSTVRSEVENVDREGGGDSTINVAAVNAWKKRYLDIARSLQ